MARVRKEVHAAVTTGSAETSRHSPRDGWNGCFAFSPVPGLSGHRPSCDAKHQHEVDISVGISGPRDLTVRIVLFVGADKPRCNTDTPTTSRLNVRDDREAPL